MPAKTIRKPKEPETETGLQDVLTAWGLGETDIEIPIVGEVPKQEQAQEPAKKEEYEYIQLPTKQSLYKKYDYYPDRGLWVLELPNGYILDEELLEKLGLMRTIKYRKYYSKYVVKPIYDKIKLYGISDYGSRRHPDIRVGIIINPSKDEAIRVEDEEKGRELLKKIKETKHLFQIASEKAVPTSNIQLPKVSPKIEENIFVRKFKGATLTFHPLPIMIEYSDRGGYGLISFKGEKYLTPIMSDIEKILIKYGFIKGKYGGYITYSKPDKDAVINMLNEIKDLVVKNQGTIEKIYLDEIYAAEKAKAKAIEDARRALGVGTAVPPTKPLIPTEVAKDIISMIRHVETKRRLEEKIEKATEEFVKKLEKITPEDLARIMAEKGYVERKLIVFDLPSEARKSKTRYRKEGNLVIEERIYTVDPKKFRSLRKKFYNILHKIAFRTPAGWIMLSNVDKKYLEEHLKELNKIIDEFNKLADTSRTVWIYETYLPRDTVVEWLRKNIAEQKADIEKIKEKLQSEELKHRDKIRLMKAHSEALDELSRLEDELKKLQRELEEYT